MGTALLLGACNQATTSPPAETAKKPSSASAAPTAEVSTAPVLDEELLAEYQRAVDEAAQANPDALTAVWAAPPMVTGDPNQATAIGDVSESPWDPGRYRLTIYCAGTGNLVATLTMGDYGTTETLPACTPEIAVGTVTLDVPKKVDSLETTIAPAGKVNAAISYILTRD